MREKRPVAERVLVEGGELREASVHRARPCVQFA
jgi:hypothetical protein